MKMKVYLDEKSKRILELISHKKNDKILVIGTGVFPKIEYFLFHNFGCKNIISTDISEKNLENGRKILPINFIKINAENKFSFKDSKFDKVIFCDVLEHLDNEENALSEINRVLNKSGKLILTIPKKRWFNIFSPITLFQHKREYTEKEIINKLKYAGFKVEKVFVGGSIYDLFNLWLHLIYKYFLNKMKSDFFRDKIDKANKKNFKGKGTGIIIEARKWNL